MPRSRYEKWRDEQVQMMIRTHYKKWEAAPGFAPMASYFDADYDLVGLVGVLSGAPDWASALTFPIATVAGLHYASFAVGATGFDEDGAQEMLTVFTGGKDVALEVAIVPYTMRDGLPWYSDVETMGTGGNAFAALIEDAWVRGADACWIDGTGVQELLGHTTDEAMRTAVGVMTEMGYVYGEVRR